MLLRTECESWPALFTGSIKCCILNMDDILAGHTCMFYGAVLNFSLFLLHHVLIVINTLIYLFL